MIEDLKSGDVWMLKVAERHLEEAVDRLAETKHPDLGSPWHDDIVSRIYAIRDEIQSRHK